MDGGTKPRVAVVSKRPTREEAMEAVRTLLAWAGDNPAREGLRDTPKRVVDAYEEWFAGYFEDPRDYLKTVTCPVLAINGEKDMQVPPKQDLPEIDKALKAGGNEDVTTVELPNLNHLFQNCKTGSPNEYANIEETFAPAALELVTTWIRKHSGFGSQGT